MSTAGKSTFPPFVQAMLRAAASTPVPPGDVMARARAINAAIAKAKLIAPECFRQEALAHGEPAEIRS